MGFFRLDGPFAEVNREAVLLLAGPRALLLQLAHPLVAAGVAAHSDFLRDPLGRLRRTLDAMLTIVFGDREAALGSAERIRAAHRRVHGTLSEGTSTFPAGTPYDAQDPELGLWVHATLVDSSLVAYERFVRPLDPRVRERFYRESRIVASLLDLPHPRVPTTLAAFEAYVRGMIDGPILEVTPTAAGLADAVLHPPIRFVPRLLGDVAGVLTAGLLPPSLRERYRLPWDPFRERAFRLAVAGVRRTLPLLPEFARVMPHARRAARRRAG